MNNCKIIAVANQKGGTAKSTTACNLSNALAAAGHRVLCADMDPQANLSMSLGIERPNELGASMHSILSFIMQKDFDGVLPDKSEYIISGKNLDIIPSNTNLLVTEMNLRNEIGSERVLSELLESLRFDYTYIVIDTSTAMGNLTINALAACDSVIIPVCPEKWAADGVVEVLQTISRIKRKINPRIEVEGILMTICDERTGLFKDTKALLDDICKDRVKDRLRVFNTRIPRTVGIGKANYSNISIIEFDKRSKAAIAYVKLAEEVSGYASSNEIAATA